MPKTFVLDTNVLLHNSDSIESFADNTVIIPMAVIEELDRFKAHNDELGRNARQVIRRLDVLRSKGNLRDGVPLEKNGFLKIVSNSFNQEDRPFDADIPDNRIIQVAYSILQQGENVIFVSKDINARIKADAIGLKAVDFEKQTVNFSELYSGYNEIEVEGKLVDKFVEDKTLRIDESLTQFPNQFVMLIDEENNKHTALGRVAETGLINILPSKHERIWNIRSRNREQRMALELLMDKNVQIVTLVGQAGTGKTLIALAAALHSTIKDKAFDRILVSRPIVPLGKDIGYLPGDKDEKLSHWMQPIFDNLIYLLREGMEPVDGKKKVKNTPMTRMDQLFSDDIIELEALTYIRGRTIPGQFVIVDEAQNLTPHEVKTIVSRAGEGTKMVLTGDPYQIDNPYLDASSNGLTYAAERLKAQQIHGHVTLINSERSHLAAIAAAYL